MKVSNRWIRLQDFAYAESVRRNVVRQTVISGLYSGAYGHVQQKAKNKRVLLIKITAKLPPPNKPRPGEVTEKQFVMDESEKSGVLAKSIYTRIQRGYYNGSIKLRRLNQRVVFVRRVASNTQLCSASDASASAQG